jgi:hypothetical protein
VDRRSGYQNQREICTGSRQGHPGGATRILLLPVRIKGSARQPIMPPPRTYERIGTRTIPKGSREI